MDYQTEKKQEAQQMAELAKGVAKAMGWSVEKPSDEMESHPRRTMISPDKTQRISMGLVWNKKDRVTVSGEFYSFGLQNFLPYKAENPDITVAIARGAEVIAKEITRRVLPGYAELLQKARESKGRADAHQAKVTSNASELLAVLANQTVRQGRDNDTFFFEGGEARVSSDSATLKLDLSIEQAKAVLQLIRERN